MEFATEPFISGAGAGGGAGAGAGIGAATGTGSGAGNGNVAAPSSTKSGRSKSPAANARGAARREATPTSASSKAQRSGGGAQATCPNCGCGCGTRDALLSHLRACLLSQEAPAGPEMTPGPGGGALALRQSRDAEELQVLTDPVEPSSGHGTSRNANQRGDADPASSSPARARSSGRAGSRGRTGRQQQGTGREAGRETDTFEGEGSPSVGCPFCGRPCTREHLSNHLLRCRKHKETRERRIHAVTDPVAQTLRGPAHTFGPAIRA